MDCLLLDLKLKGMMNGGRGTEKRGTKGWKESFILELLLKLVFAVTEKDSLKKAIE